jgi:hypothetical protein
VNRVDDSVSLSMTLWKNTSPWKQRRKKMQLIRKKCHRSFSAKRSCHFNALQTVGADAVIGSRESSRKHKYKTAVIQEHLGACGSRGKMGLHNISTKIRQQRSLDL